MSKKIILSLLLIILSTISCKAQDNKILINEITLNSKSFLYKDSAFLSQNFGQASKIENEYFEMDEVNSNKYIYNGLTFYLINNKIVLFEITSSNFAFTQHNIRIGNNINTLENIYPLSYKNKKNTSLSLNIGNYDNFITIFFNENTNLIEKIRMGTY